MMQKILIVEDDIDIQDILKNHLIDAGYEVAVASDGVAGALLFGSVGGFIYNYVGICAGSIIAFFLAKHYGIPLVQAIFPSKKYNVWTERIRKTKSYDVLFGLSVLLPLAPDDYLCYFSGLINMSVKKFILIILLTKPWCILFYSFGTGMIIH